MLSEIFGPGCVILNFDHEVILERRQESACLEDILRLHKPVATWSPAVSPWRRKIGQVFLCVH